MRTLPILASLLLTPAAFAQSALQSLWVEQIQGGVAGGGFVDADGSGGVLLFGTDSGPFGSPPPGGDEVFVARYSRDGTPQWVERFGSMDIERSAAILADGSGGAFVAGTTQGSLAAPLDGLSDAFLARYDGDGNQLWILQAGSAGGDSFLDLASDGAGGCFALGQTDQSWSGPFLGGVRDMVLQRYDGQGNLLWGTQFGTERDDFALSVALDGAGGALVSGVNGGGTFPGGSTGSGPSFIARFDAAGTLTSVVRFGAMSEQVVAAQPDGAGGAYLAGVTVTGTSVLTIDGYAQRIDAAGQPLWTQPIITPGLYTIPSELRLSAAGLPVMASTTYSGFIIPGSPSVINPQDGLVSRYDAAGALLSHDVVGGPRSDSFESMALDGSAGVWLGGHTAGSFGGPANSGYQLFAARFGFTIGSAYCSPAVPNSSGVPGRTSALGSDAAADDAITLAATDLPTATFGYFITSQTTALVPLAGGGQGTLCLGGSVGRYNRSGEVGATGNSGSFFLDVSLGAIPQPTGSVTAVSGETWNFQAWYRDANPMSTSNFTDAVAVTLQ